MATRTKIYCVQKADPGGKASQSRALDILKERLARGEIDKEEFVERRRALGE